jgi:hypothetical protein
MRRLAPFLMMLVLAACGDTQGGGVPQQSDARAMMSLIAADPVLKAYPNVCPAEIYGSEVNRAGPQLNCAINMRFCLTQCKDGDRDACFDAAQVIEAETNAGDVLATYPLYMRGCALGDGNACVNAGATIKNARWRGGRPAEASTPLCQLRTFSDMCDAGHAWGCYMAAQEYRAGGHGGESDGRYATYMRRACAISATSGACTATFR